MITSTCLRAKLSAISMSKLKGDRQMKNKPAIWIVTILQALPVPISLFTILGSIISLANIGVLYDASPFLALVSVLFMVFAAIYPEIFAASTFITFFKKKLSVISFLPALHMIITLALFVAWISLEKIYL